jgi:hypothetical protein
MNKEKIEYVILPPSWIQTIKGISTVADVAYVLGRRVYNLKESTAVEFNGVLLEIPYKAEIPLELATARAVTFWWESVLFLKGDPSFDLRRTIR